MRTFHVKPVWDDQAGVFYCESDIEGLHIEAKTLDEFIEMLHATAAELIFANHISKQDMASKPLQDLVPAIMLERPALEVA